MWESFLSSDYMFSNSSRLKDEAVPSVFQFPSHLEKSEVARPPPKKRKLDTREQNKTPTEYMETSPKSPTKDELKLLLKSKNDKLKTLKQKLRRKEKKVLSLKGSIQEMKLL